MSEEKRKCNRCKVERPTKYFSLRGNDEYKKSCDACLEKFKESRNKNKCEHGKQKTYCQICGGGSICIHSQVKSICVLCSGVSICKHKKKKNRCKECNGNDLCCHNKVKFSCKECGDPIHITIQNWIHNSKKEDIKWDRYMHETKKNFIDYDYCRKLVSFYKHCYHCSVPLQYIIFQDNLATIERLNNGYGHTKENCVIACKKCNQKGGIKYREELRKKKNKEKPI